MSNSSSVHCRCCCIFTKVLKDQIVSQESKSSLQCPKRCPGCSSLSSDLLRRNSGAALKLTSVRWGLLARLSIEERLCPQDQDNNGWWGLSVTTYANSVLCTVGTNNPFLWRCRGASRRGISSKELEQSLSTAPWKSVGKGVGEGFGSLRIGQWGIHFIRLLPCSRTFCHSP